MTKEDKYEDILLHGRAEFKGGILESDRVVDWDVMETETKEVLSTPTTERKDVEVKSGTQAPPREHPGVVHYAPSETRPRRDESE